MKLLPLLFGALQAGDKINCYWCEYVWEEFEGEVTPIKGESSCRDGALENIAQKSYSVSGTSESKWDYATRCGHAETIGYETVYEGDKEEIKEFHIFERRGFKVPAESSLATHNGEMRLEEEGRLCGANRPECTGNYMTGSPNTEPCETENACKCLRCEATQVRKLGILDYINGDGTCKTANGPYQEDTECIVGAGPERLHRRSLPSDINQTYEDPIGGTCYIWQETYKQDGMIEMQQFTRSCDVNDVRPLNIWSEISSKSDNLYLCGDDLCNAPDLNGGGGGDSSAAAYSLLALVAMLF